MQNRDAHQPINMKKFVMSKVNNADAGSPPLQHNGVLGLDMSPEDREERTADEGEFQPPLPVEPPLSPLKIPKQEIEDVETNEEDIGEQIEPIDQMQLMKADEQNKTVEPEMCRDFIRGTCTRVGCRFRHEPDVTALHRVYTFCHDFQNKGCTHPKCKYVHATVAEKEAYHRTGYLPPHTLAHRNAAPPPPPAAPHAPVAAPAAAASATASASTVRRNKDLKFSINLKNPSSMLQSTENKPLAVVSCIPMASVDTINSELKNNLDHKALLKVNWNDLTDDSDDSKQPCPSCDVKENRLQHAKDQFDGLIETASATKRKMNLLDEKLKRVELLNKALGFRAADQPNGINILQILPLLNNMGK